MTIREKIYDDKTYTWNHIKKLKDDGIKKYGKEVCQEKIRNKTQVWKKL